VNDDCHETKHSWERQRKVKKSNGRETRYKASSAAENRGSVSQGTYLGKPTRTVEFLKKETISHYKNWCSPTKKEKKKSGGGTDGRGSPILKVKLTNI